MASSPTTPVRVPKAAATYDIATQDPDLRSQINAVLLGGGHIQRIQETLLHALNASSTNWPTNIQKHALSLLRSGECSSFPDLMERVMTDIQSSQSQNAVNGNRMKNGQENGLSADGKTEGNLALPKNVVEEGVKITRECLEMVCEVQE